MMKRRHTLVLLLLLLAISQPLPAGQGGPGMDATMKMVEQIEWLGQAAIRITADKAVVLIDPYKLKEDAEPAPLVLVTHAHGDHCSPDDLAKVVGESTVLVAPQDCLEKLAELSPKQTISLAPGEEATVAGIRIEAVPAYNVVKTKFHPKENGWVGYILTIDKIRIYHLGDTERIPEMQELRCDIALVPLGQTYTMEDVEEAAAAVRDLKATVAIPIHFGMYEGTAADATAFEQLLADDCRVVIKSFPTK